MVGPFTLDRTYTCDEYSLLRTAAIAAADPTVNFTSYTRVFIVFPNPGGCGWAGLGSLGCGTLSSQDGSFQASTSWLRADYMGDTNNGVKLATHEGGHNLTLHHSSSRSFGVEPLGAIGTAGTLSEYGDPFATMGSWNYGHYAAPHKVSMGWLSGSQVLTTESTGSYSVVPFETPSTSVQAMKIRRGTGNNAWLWVEYRQPTGLFDSSFSATSQMFTGALVHYEDSTTGTRTQLLDFTPSSANGFSDPSLTGTWVDPYSNVTLSVTGTSASALALNVNYGTLPCTRLAPTVSLTPPNPSVAAGANGSYTLSITNNDSAGCSSSLFSLASTLPSGWTTSFGANALTVSPAQTLSTTITKSVPAGTAPGTYAVDASAADANHPSVAATANITVTAPVAPITLSLSANPLSVAARSSVTLSATAIWNSAPLAGQTVTFTVTRSGAGTATLSATTNASGVATVSYRAQQKGSYSAVAKATAPDGGSGTSNTISFTAN